MKSQEGVGKVSPKRLFRVDGKCGELWLRRIWMSGVHVCAREGSLSPPTSLALSVRKLIIHDLNILSFDWGSVVTNSCTVAPTKYEHYEYEYKNGGNEERDRCSQIDQVYTHVGYRITANAVRSLTSSRRLSRSSFPYLYSKDSPTQPSLTQPSRTPIIRT